MSEHAKLQVIQYLERKFMVDSSTAEGKAWLVDVAHDVLYIIKQHNPILRQP